MLLLVGICCQYSFGQQSNTNKKKVAINKQSINPSKALYQSLLKTWCDGILALQIKGGKDDGGIYDEAKKFVLGRGGEVVYPLLAMYTATGDEKYKAAALKAYSWWENMYLKPMVPGPMKRMAKTIGRVSLFLERLPSAKHCIIMVLAYPVQKKNNGQKGFAKAAIMC